MMSDSLACLAPFATYLPCLALMLAAFITGWLIGARLK